MSKENLTYRAAGVSIEAGDDFTQQLRSIAESTHSPAVLPAPGGFAGLFRLSGEEKKAQLLVACADGVGTKLRIAFQLNQHNTVGIDLVAMSVNDCIVTGAQPLFFLDYIGTGKLEIETSLEIMKGIGEGCRQAGCALLGGETAEMPGMYPEGEYDLAGFCVGNVSEDQLLDPKKNIQPGNVILGIPSAGLHSNGYSLARKALLDRAGYQLESYNDSLGTTIGVELLKPTRIYVQLIMNLLDSDLRQFIYGMAHITGGGLVGNLPRILPENCDARIDKNAYPHLPIFDLIQQAGNIKEVEMWRVFNMGIGFTLVVNSARTDQIINHLVKLGEEPKIIGEIIPGSGRIIT